MDFSLMEPQNAEHSYTTLSDEAINDLSLDFILDALTEKRSERPVLRGMLSKLPTDPETIRYRRDIFEDFLRFPKLRASMTELVMKLADLRDLERFQMDSNDSVLWTLVNRLRAIDEYMTCITMIRDCLTGLDIQSEGMCALRDMVTSIPEESGFDALKADVDEMMSKAREVKSITIGVNLDSFLRPEYAGIVSLNDTKYSNPGLMSRFMKFTEGKDNLHKGVDNKSRRFHPSNPNNSKGTFAGLMVDAAAATAVNHNSNHIDADNITGKDALSDALRHQVSDIMSRTVADIKNTLRKHISVNAYSLTGIMPEVLCYNRWAELTEKLIASGMPMCKPGILSSEERSCTFKDVYNLKLAINKMRGEEINIITNDFDFNDERRIYILTGPNRGGKTIFTQAIGIAMLMAQWGVYIPAGSAEISPCDNIFTHFPADENETVDLGRLGEESQRLSKIFKTATRHSLLLLNESLATTSVAEGVFIAKGVVKSMRYLGVRSIFNTHMHELATSVGEINEAVEGESRVESLITGIHGGERSFKVIIAPPQGVSYAADIAKRYGVTFEQIKNDIDGRSAD